MTLPNGAFYEIAYDVGVPKGGAPKGLPLLRLTTGAQENARC
jgi:hypothetical protein